MLLVNVYILKTIADNMRNYMQTNKLGTHAIGPVALPKHWVKKKEKKRNEKKKKLTHHVGGESGGGGCGVCSVRQMRAVRS